MDLCLNRVYKTIDEHIELPANLKLIALRLFLRSNKSKINQDEIWSNKVQKVEKQYARERAKVNASEIESERNCESAELNDNRNKEQDEKGKTF